MQNSQPSQVLNSYHQAQLAANEPNDILSSYYHSLAEHEPKYTTARTGVRKNPDAPPEKKKMHTIEPPKVSTQHF